MEFKDRLIQLRKEKHLNQEEFAKKIGYTRTAISAWEVGRNEPSNADTIKIADFFEVSLDYLLGKSDIRNPKEIKIDDIDIAFASGIKGLNDENKAVAKSIIDSLLAKQKMEEDKKEKK